MVFETPTTKTKMYEILQEIFHYYRIKRDDFIGAELEPLELERQEFIALSDSELLSKAETLLSGKHQREIVEYQSKISQEIAGLNAKITQLNADKESAVAQIQALYFDSENKIREEAIKNGITASNIVTDKIAQMEGQKNEKIAQSNASYSQLIADCNLLIAELEAKLNGADEHFTVIHQNEILAKVEELKEQQEEQRISVFKYNNSVYEKELKYRNVITKSNLELRLKFMEIQSGEITKDQLVDIGYYDDVLACVEGYYNNLSASAAYNDIIQESRLMVFLDDYYQNIIYMYKLRAGA